MPEFRSRWMSPEMAEIQPETPRYATARTDKTPFVSSVSSLEGRSEANPALPPSCAVCGLVDWRYELEARHCCGCGAVVALDGESMAVPGVDDRTIRRDLDPPAANAAPEPTPIRDVQAAPATLTAACWKPGHVETWESPGGLLCSLCHPPPGMDIVTFAGATIPVAIEGECNCAVMPAGQRCSTCAAQAVARWKAATS